MYGTQSGMDLSFRNGREVIRLAIGVYQVQFGFDEDVRIAVGAGFRHFDGKDELVWKTESGSPHIAACTVALLDATIERFEGQQDGT